MISCVIPTYNGKHLLAKNLKTVLRALPDQSELIISDDASTDDTLGWLTERFDLETDSNFVVRPQPHFFPDPKDLKIQVMTGQTKVGQKRIELVVLGNQVNLRFAGAVNLGALVAKGEYLLILNNDVSPHPDAFMKLLATIQKNEQFFAVACKEFEENEAGEPSGKNKLWFESGLFQHSKASEFSAGETAWASGGSSLLRLDQFKKLKGFDHRYYPAYWEDIDLCFRARKNGWKILFEPTAVMMHQHESTHQVVWKKQELLHISWRNADRFTWKNGDIWQKISFLLWRPYWWWQRSRYSASQE